MFWEVKLVSWCSNQQRFDYKIDGWECLNEIVFVLHSWPWPCLITTKPEQKRLVTCSARGDWGELNITNYDGLLRKYFGEHYKDLFNPLFGEMENNCSKNFGWRTNFIVKNVVRKKKKILEISFFPPFFLQTNIIKIQ